MAQFQTLPGFREFYPEECARRNHLFRLWRQAAVAANFLEFDGPVLEPLELYKAKSGEEIEQQLFSFTDKGGRDVSLRPEMTPTLCRLVGERAGALRRPIKWFNIGEHYRYERAQKGRLRAFFQFNADLLGEAGPEAEVELIALLIACIGATGLSESDFFIRLSDRNLWFFYLQAIGFTEAQVPDVLGTIDRLEKQGDDAFKFYEEKHGPLSAAQRSEVTSFTKINSLDALEQRLAPLTSAGGAAAEALAGRLADWRTLLGGLESMGLGAYIQVDLGVVRGLAYYTGFVFEAFDRSGEFRAIAGGGRYNNLVKKLGGPDMPAAGFAIGDVVISEMLKSKNLLPTLVQAPDVFCIIGGPAERPAALADIRAMRAAGIRVEYPLKDSSFGKQFKQADQNNARLAIIYGGDELARGAVKMKLLADASEREVRRDHLLQAVSEFLGYE
jgi:histidyl-tRNA synthetase